MCNRCTTCAICRLERKEPPLTSSFPEYASEQMGTDLFELEKKKYIIVVDYFSRWIECRHLSQTTSAYAIEALQSIFNVHGIPDHVISDNGPQYSSDGFKAFSEEYGFVNITLSPLYPQSNGEAKRDVQTAKNILKNNTDPHLGFLAYRTTPLHNGQSPVELLMRRTFRWTLPVTQDALKKYPTGTLKSFVLGRNSTGTNQRKTTTGTIKQLHSHLSPAVIWSGFKTKKCLVKSRSD